MHRSSLKLSKGDVPKRRCVESLFVLLPFTITQHGTAQYSDSIWVALHVRDTDATVPVLHDRHSLGRWGTLYTVAREMGSRVYLRSCINRKHIRARTREEPSFTGKSFSSPVVTLLRNILLWPMTAQIEW